MSDSDPDRERSNLFSELTVFAVLGAGFLALFAGAEWFWMVWVFGFAVVLPVVSILERRLARSTRSGPGPYAPDHHENARKTRREEEEEALEALKRRYAEGEIDEVEFENRLELLFENEDIEDVRRRFEEEDLEFEYGRE